MTKHRQSGVSNQPILSELRSLLGKENVLTKREDLIVYSYDASASADEQMPLCILTPGSCDEVAAIVRLAVKYAVPVVPRGSGTGLAGASIPSPGSMVLLTTRMNRILEIDSDNLTALIEPGVITADLAAAVEEQGLFYPPDPASMSISTLGGNIALDSGGLRGLKYGVTRDYVIGLEVVLASGQVLHTGGKCKKDAAGYHLTSLFVGSEGTLGVITQALVRLIPLPAAQRTAVAYFEDVAAAAEVVAETIAAKIIPVTLELLDQTSLRCVDEYTGLGLPRDAGAMLLIEVDGTEAQVREEIEKIAGICRTHRAHSVEVAQDEGHADQLRTARRSTLAALARRKPTTILEDVTVPRSRIPEMVRRITRIADQHQIDLAIFGHAGDGNLHPTAMADARDEDEIARVEAAFCDIFEAAIDLEGTITGEHGVGLKKRHFLPQRVGQAGMNTMESIKRALDPHNILNPHKVVEL